LLDIVNHYNGFRKLALTEPEKKGLVKYLKSLWLPVARIAANK